MLFQCVPTSPGEPLPLEALGPVVDVTKRLKPSLKRVTKCDDGAHVQAVTRVNAEQASKKDDAQADPTTVPGARQIRRDGSSKTVPPGAVPG